MGLGERDDAAERAPRRVGAAVGAEHGGARRETRPDPQPSPRRPGAVESGDLHRADAAAVDADPLETGSAVPVRREHELLPVGRPRRIALVPPVVAGQAEGDAPLGGQQKEVVAAPDVGGEGDQPPVRRDCRAGAEGRLLDVDLARVARTLDPEQPPGAREVGAIRDRDDEVVRTAEREARARVRLDLVGTPAPDQRVGSVGGDRTDVEAARSGRGMDDPSVRGRPWVEVHGEVAREPGRRSSGGGDPVDVQVAVEVAGEDQCLPVGIPVRLEVVGRARIVGAAGDLARHPAGDRDRPDPPVERECDLPTVGRPGRVCRPGGDAGDEVVLDADLSARDGRVAQRAHLRRGEPGGQQDRGEGGGEEARHGGPSSIPEASARPVGFPDRARIAAPRVAASNLAVPEPPGEANPWPTATCWN